MPVSIATGLPDLTLLPGTIIRVEANAGATVNQVNIHGFQVTPPPRAQAQPVLRPRSGT